MRYFMCLSCKRRIECYDKQEVVMCACGESDENFIIELNSDGSRKNDLGKCIN